MASGEASSVLPNSAERELPANVPPAITADKQSVDGSNPSGGVTVIPTVFSVLLGAVFFLKTNVCAQSCAQFQPKLNRTGGGAGITAHINE